MVLLSQSQKVEQNFTNNSFVPKNDSGPQQEADSPDVKSVVRSVFDGKSNTSIDDTRTFRPLSSMQSWEKKDEIQFSLKMHNYMKTGEMFSRVNLNTDSISAEEIDEIINDYRSALDLTDNIQDGVIGSFKQGTIGDCGYLASLKVIASTKEGAKIINDSIKKNKDNSFNVSFLGAPGKVYTVSEKELAKDTEFSTGDKDVKILEIAANKWRLETKKKSLEAIEYPEVKRLITGKGYSFYSKSSTATIIPKEPDGNAVLVDTKDFLKNIPDKRFFFADLLKTENRHGYFVEKAKNNLLFFDPNNTTKDPQIISIDDFVKMKDTEIIY